MSPLEHVDKPWGGYDVLDEGATCKVKRLTVRPGARLSYQSHERRAEHWIVIAGTADVLVDGEARVVATGESIDIPRNAKHRVGNRGDTDLVFVEVQLGDYFGEDDVVRYEDDYGRVG